MKSNFVIPHDLKTVDSAVIRKTLVEINKLIKVIEKATENCYICIMTEDTILSETFKYNVNKDDSYALKQRNYPEFTKGDVIFNPFEYNKFKIKVLKYIKGKLKYQLKLKSVTTILNNE